MREVSRKARKRRIRNLPRASPSPSGKSTKWFFPKEEGQWSERGFAQSAEAKDTEFAPTSSGGPRDFQNPGYLIESRHEGLELFAVLDVYL